MGKKELHEISNGYISKDYCYQSCRSQLSEKQRKRSDNKFKARREKLSPYLEPRRTPKYKPVNQI